MGDLFPEVLYFPSTAGTPGQEVIKDYSIRNQWIRRVILLHDNTGTGHGVTLESNGVAFFPQVGINIAFTTYTGGYFIGGEYPLAGFNIKEHNYPIEFKQIGPPYNIRVRVVPLSSPTANLCIILLTSNNPPQVQNLYNLVNKFKSTAEHAYGNRSIYQIGEYMRGIIK